MTQTVLIYIKRRQQGRLLKQGVDILAEYDDYVLARVTDEQMAQLRAAGYEVEPYEPPSMVKDMAQPATRGRHEMNADAARSSWGPPSPYTR